MCHPIMHSPTDAQLIQAIREARCEHFDKVESVAAVRYTIRMEHVDWLVSKKVCSFIFACVALLSREDSASPSSGRRHPK